MGGKFLGKIESPGAIALLAGVVCYVFALVVTILLPVWLTNQDENRVVGLDGVERTVPPYSEAEAAGREVYGKQVCFHCHSQFVRPVNEEDKRFGPVSQTGEYVHDRPHFFGTRRTGPDLHREGGLRIDEWHYAHFYNPRYTVPRSVMPAFPWLFTENPVAADVAFVLKWLDTSGDGVLSTSLGDDAGPAPEGATAEVARARTLAANRDPLTRIDRRGLLGVGEAKDSMWYVEEPESGDLLVTDYDGGPLPKDECRHLVAYMQRMGTSIGQWRRPLYAPTPERASPFDAVDPRPRKSGAMRVHGFKAKDKAWVEVAAKAAGEHRAAVAAWDARHPILAQRLVKGAELYAKHCAGCHGDEGRGNGPAAAFLSIRPRDFTIGKYKFRSTPVGALPLDGDIYRSIHRGLPGSSMPAWYELADEQIWLLVDYLKSLYEGEGGFNDRTRVTPTAPERFPVNRRAELLRGRAVYLSGASQCYNCHGLEGRADGPGWNTQATQYGGAQRPRDLRPRIVPADAPALYALLGKKLAHVVGAEGWASLSKAEAWAGLAPRDEATNETFVRFLLGEGPAVVDVLGGVDAVKEAFGARYARLFDKGDDPLEDARMDAATEKDRPSLRMRNGAGAHDLYRVIMTGIEGTAMKATWSEFWQAVDPKPEFDTGFRTPAERRFSFVPKSGVETRLSVTTKDPRLATVGVKTRNNDKGEPEEFLQLMPGDDWALVHYVQWLMCEPRQRVGR